MDSVNLESMFSWGKRKVKDCQETFIDIIESAKLFFWSGGILDCLQISISLLTTNIPRLVDANITADGMSRKETEVYQHGRQSHVARFVDFASEVNILVFGL